jgi:hypothetical protein
LVFDTCIASEEFKQDKVGQKRLSYQNKCIKTKLGVQLECAAYDFRGKIEFWLFGDFKEHP